MQYTVKEWVNRENEREEAGVGLRVISKELRENDTIGILLKS